MDYLVIARKYRPQTFSEVSGQAVVARTLTNAIKANRLHHAWLFTGPRGVGKTSMARILAKALCCVGADGSGTAPTATPCGVCEQCRMITDGTHPDVSEIDAARFGTVDTVRSLADDAGFAPSLARLRILILDEVHMLSTSAWNALLKLLEEPPPHLRFIFATTEVEKVLPTVLSRVQRFDFRSIDNEDIVGRLKAIVSAEKLAIPDALLYRIARAAGGGMRDAQTLLDQLIAVSDGAITEEDLNLLLGAARGEDLLALSGDLAAGKTAPALETIDRIVSDGVAPATLINQLVDHFRALLLVQACGTDSPAVRRLGVPSAVLAAQAKALSPEKALRICQLLLGSQQALRQGVEARLQLELACVRIAGLGQVADLDTLLRRLERLEAAGPGPTGTGAAAAAGGSDRPRPR